MPGPIRNSAGAMRGMVGDGECRPVNIDQITRAQIMINEDKHAIHKGNLYTAHKIRALDAFDIASPMTWRFTTPSNGKLVHFNARLSCSTAARLEIFEDDGDIGHFLVTAGTSYTPINHCRNCNKISCVKTWYDVTVTAASSNVRIYDEQIGGVFTGGQLTSISNFVLRQDTQYLVRATTLADDNEGSLILVFHEHTNED